jgi:hypothetical protein
MSIFWTSRDKKYFISSDSSLLEGSDPSELAEGVPWMKETNGVRTRVIQLSREVFGVYFTGRDTTSMCLFYYLAESLGFF